MASAFDPSARSKRQGVCGMARAAQPQGVALQRHGVRTLHSQLTALKSAPGGLRAAAPTAPAHR